MIYGRFNKLSYFSDILGISFPKPKEILPQFKFIGVTMSESVSLFSILQHLCLFSNLTAQNAGTLDVVIFVVKVSNIMGTMDWEDNQKIHFVFIYFH